MTNILFVVNYQRLIIITQIIDYQRQLRKLSYILLLNQFMKENQDSTLRGVSLSGKFIPPLPGTEQEVKDIFDLFQKKHRKAQVLLYNSATERFVKSDSVQQFRILHFGTHGFVNTQKPELSGILLAQVADSATQNVQLFQKVERLSNYNDGVLYAGEIYNLKLNADLVVLSACETGLGKVKRGEGIIGLTRALLYAGTKNIVVSLWTVDDRGTQFFMTDFYRLLLEKKSVKQGYSGILRQTKLDLIRSGYLSHPFYWSPFILVGK